MLRLTGASLVIMFITGSARRRNGLPVYQPLFTNAFASAVNGGQYLALVTRLWYLTICLCGSLYTIVLHLTPGFSRERSSAQNATRVPPEKWCTNMFGKWMTKLDFGTTSLPLRGSTHGYKPGLEEPAISPQTYCVTTVLLRFPSTGRYVTQNVSGCLISQTHGFVTDSNQM